MKSKYVKPGNILKLIYVLIMLAGSCCFTYAQNTATGSVSANVVVPIALVKNVDMNFGNASVSVSTGGTVVLTPSGTRSAGGAGVTLPATAGTVAAAKFIVSGAPSYTYAITLPSNVTISGPGSATMMVNGFTSAPSASGTLSAVGTQTLSVGATLTIAASQIPGIYANATAVPVTVNYN